VPLHIRNLRLSGDADFKLVSEDCTSRLVTLDGCEVEIEFTPPSSASARLGSSSRPTRRRAAVSR
jgi:hypothetical protein